jgi:para-nitrobenzyl esterase
VKGREVALPLGSAAGRGAGGRGAGHGAGAAAGEEAGAKIATALGLPGASATIEQLRALTPDQMVNNTASRAGVSGVLDGKIKTVSTADALKAHSEIDVPLIVGSNSGEGGADGAKTLVDLASGGAPSFQYYFTYVPAWRTTEQPNGAPHSAEIPYAFAALATSTTGGGARVTDRDRAVSERMNNCWVAFAKMPVTSKTISCPGGFAWAARTAANDAIAVFGETPQLATATPIVEAQAAAAKARAAAANTRASTN